jgi:hypothetical protein
LKLAKGIGPAWLVEKRINAKPAARRPDELHRAWRSNATLPEMLMQ